MKNLTAHIWLLTLMLLMMIIFTLGAYWRGRSALNSVLGDSLDPRAATCHLIGIQNFIPDCVQSNNLKTEVANNSSLLRVGAYDPYRTLVSSDLIGLDHYYISWNRFIRGYARQLIGLSEMTGRIAFITIEPYSKNELTGTQMLQEITSGVYDETIDGICEEINATQHKVYVRWGHEMEYLSGRYPWAQPDTRAYISAYQHFVDRCRLKTNNAYYVWSPAGNKNLADYWPGEGYVDYVGFSLYDFPEWENTLYGLHTPLEMRLRERYALVKNYNKPIIIAEFGVVGDALYRQEWLQDLAGLLRSDEFQSINLILYFNSEDTPGVWGDQVPNPDWSLDAIEFTNFIKRLQTS